MVSLSSTYCNTLVYIGIGDSCSEAAEAEAEAEGTVAGGRVLAEVFLCAGAALRGGERRSPSVMLSPLGIDCT